ncbi:MAG: acyl-CoA reductase [Bacteroidetes bacterium]|nr:acyl-CoA reductase [Bacteroidota bacterium]MBU1486293.1 acyl-CoA reductase [Bacteroidota bacterium]MBU2267214.1 acyl-CoA reductase [Bacteroidota bacterium]MBU2376071.1 acyl-CoA reductase [Bacteroidota bacterium]
MSEFYKERKVEGLKRLGDFLLEPDDDFKDILSFAKHKNGWFTLEEVSKAVAANGKMLNIADLETWLAGYKIESHEPKKIGLILAGNLPLVGFHDIISVLMSGNIALIKLSSQDDILIPAILKKLIAIEPEFENQIQYVERLENFDAVIATGSNNSSRYFDYYFSKVPNIIRKNRNSVAVLSGEESSEELKRLGSDIFDYYGLGCRNISKMFVPKGYVFNHFFESIEEFSPILNHHKYQNNYDYNKSIYLVNRVEHLDNGFLLIAPSENLSSPLSVVYQEAYDDLESLKEKINTQADQIQVVSTQMDLHLNTPSVKLGDSQNPKLWDYADSVDTMEFLIGLS